MNDETKARAEAYVREEKQKESNPRTKLLFEAERAVNGDRNVQYGDPSADFKRIATLWNAYLGQNFCLQPEDVAVMMILLKTSRLSWNPKKFDSWMDIAGYAACGWDVMSPGSQE